MIAEAHLERLLSEMRFAHQALAMSGREMTVDLICRRIPAIADLERWWPGLAQLFCEAAAGDVGAEERLTAALEAMIEVNSSRIGHA